METEDTKARGQQREQGRVETKEKKGPRTMIMEVTAGTLNEEEMAAGY